MDSATYLKSTREAADHVAITLAVEFYLACFVLDELRLVTPLDRSQFFSAAARQEHAGQTEREQANQQQHSQHDIKQTNSTKAFEHQRFS